MLFSPGESNQSHLKRTEAPQVASGWPCAQVQECVQGSSGSTRQCNQLNRTSASPLAVQDAQYSETEDQIRQLGEQMRERVVAQQHAQMELRIRLNLAHDERSSHRVN